MPDEPAAGLEEPVLKTRRRPSLDGRGQDEPAQQIAEVVGDDTEGGRKEEYEMGDWR
jgi:hypothetical protein